jgi:hypothetical protein
MDVTTSFCHSIFSDFQVILDLRILFFSVFITNKLGPSRLKVVMSCAIGDINVGLYVSFPVTNIVFIIPLLHNSTVTAPLQLRPLSRTLQMEGEA